MRNLTTNNINKLMSVIQTRTNLNNKEAFLLACECLTAYKHRYKNAETMCEAIINIINNK